MLFLAIGMGLFMGIAIALVILVDGINKSNKMGDSQGSFGHFTANSMNYLHSEDDVGRNRLRF